MAAMIRNIILNFSQRIIGRIAVTGLAVLLIMIGQDLLQTMVNDTAFYFSESLLFESFWLFFIPGIFLIQQKIEKQRMLILIPVLTFLHIVLFSIMAWILSLAFMGHAYGIYGTIVYTISDKLAILLLVYGLIGGWHFYKKRTMKQAVMPVAAITVSSGRKTAVVPVSEIMYLKAAPPYVTVIAQRPFLYNGTLKSLEEKLDGNSFIRVHKSTIVNISQVDSYSSRMNGDYDLLLKDGSGIRLSRTYLAGFKKRLL